MNRGPRVSRGQSDVCAPRTLVIYPSFEKTVYYPDFPLAHRPRVELESVLPSQVRRGPRKSAFPRADGLDVSKKCEPRRPPSTREPQVGRPRSRWRVAFAIPAVFGCHRLVPLAETSPDSPIGKEHTRTRCGVPVPSSASVVVSRPRRKQPVWFIARLLVAELRQRPHKGGWRSPQGSCHDSAFPFVIHEYPEQASQKGPKGQGPMAACARIP